MQIKKSNNKATFSYSQKVEEPARVGKYTVSPTYQLIRNIPQKPPAEQMRSLIPESTAENTEVEEKEMKKRAEKPRMQVSVKTKRAKDEKAPIPKKAESMRKPVTKKQQLPVKSSYVDDIEESAQRQLSPEPQTEIKEVFAKEPTECVPISTIKTQVNSKISPNSQINSKKPQHKPTLLHPQDQNFIQLDKIHLTGKKLGQGGFSVVHEGSWLGVPVAVKVINLTNKKQEEKAIQEIKNMIKLRHPRIIQLYKYSLDETNSGTHLYMLMQRMQSDLTAYKYKDIYDRLRIIKQIVQGLRMLHEQLIAHRDLKPQNILIDIKGDIRIADLGISALLDSEDPRSMTMAFTLKYAPPEVYLDSVVDLKNDIWSLGLLIFQILTGIGPWNNCKKQQIIQGLVLKSSPLPEKWKENIREMTNNQRESDVLSQLISSCLQIDMKKRPTIAQVQQKLQTI